MKTFSFSILVLISSAACLQAQGLGGDIVSNRFKPLDTVRSDYYAKARAVTGRANHMLSKSSSKRPEFAKIPVGNLVPPAVVPGFADRMPGTGLSHPVLSSSESGKREAALVSMNQPIPPKRYKKAWRQDVEIQAPPAAQEVLGAIRPSPRNSSGVIGSAQDIEIVSEPPLRFRDPGRFKSPYQESANEVRRRSEGVEIGPTIDVDERTTFETLPPIESQRAEPRSTQWGYVEQEVPPQESYSQWEPQESYSQWEHVEAPATPLDAADVFERVETWEPETSQMRHVTDNFSPGGKPFAKRTHQFGDPNFFGVDRRASCDEWANVAGCGGLKANPGHLGIPWLKSKDACDERTRLRFKRSPCQSLGGCDCQCSGP